MSLKGQGRSSSIIRSVVAMLAVMALLSISISALLSYYFRMEDVMKNAGNNARIAAHLMAEPLSGYDIDEPGSPAFLEREMSRLCEGYGFEGMFIISLDDEGNAEVVAGTTQGGALGGEPEAALIQHSNNSGEASLWRVESGGGDHYLCLHPLDIPNGDSDSYQIGTVFSASVIDSAIISEMLWFTIPSAVIVLLMLVSVLLFLNLNMLAPIRQIAGSMHRFAHNYGKVENRIEIRRNNEIGEIAAAFNQMSEDIEAMIRDIHAMQEERLSERAQLDAARSIQQGIVPLRTLIKQADYEVCAMIRPAREVGGDFYDCFIREDEKLCMVIGDVSGKGVSAALYMIMVRSEIRTRLKAGMSPSEALNSVNDELCSRNPEGMFATVFAAVYDTVTRELCFANAGHNPPVLTGREPRMMQVDSGIVLGLFEDAGLEDHRISLQAGDGVLIYTDGVTEAVNQNGEWFGTEPLLRLPAGGSEQVIGALRESVERHYGGREQFDDLTALSLTVGEHEHTLRPEPGSLKDIRRILRGQFGGRMPNRIMLACEEAFVNIVNYSGADDVRLFMTQNGDAFTAEFMDNGIPFDPVNTRLPHKDPDDFDTGGMGIHIMRQAAKHLHYERREGRNILSMTFDIKDIQDAD